MFHDLLGTLVAFLPRLAGALIVLGVGLFVLARLKKLLNNLMLKKKVDISLAKFVSALCIVLLQLLLGISVVSMLGIAVSSFVAVLGAISFAVGLALQGSLSNFAGSVLILFFKPFKVGDFIEAMGLAGTVTEIGLFTTMLVAPDGQRVIIPNGTLSAKELVNYSSEPTRRMTALYRIGFHEDIDRVRAILLETLATCDAVLQDPEPMCVVSDAEESCLVLSLRCWFNREDYWDSYFYIMEETHKALKARGVEPQVPQRVIKQLA